MIHKVYLDPNAKVYSDDDIVNKINNASNAITRVDALDQDALDLVKTNPEAGDYKVKNIQFTSDGKVDIDYDDGA